MVKIECDGCGTGIATHAHDVRHGTACQGCRQGHEGHVRGLLDPVSYCETCAKEWDAYEVAEAQVRAAAVEYFEGRRRRDRQQLRRTVKRLPDDWDAAEGADLRISAESLPDAPKS